MSKISSTAIEKLRALQDEIRRVLKSSKNLHFLRDKTPAYEVDQPTLELLKEYGVKSYKIVVGDCVVFTVTDLKRWLNHYCNITPTNPPVKRMSRKRVRRCTLTDSDIYGNGERNDVFTDREQFTRMLKLEGQIKTIKGIRIA